VLGKEKIHSDIVSGTVALISFVGVSIQKKAWGNAERCGDKHEKG